MTTIIDHAFTLWESMLIDAFCEGEGTFPPDPCYRGARIDVLHEIPGREKARNRLEDLFLAAAVCAILTATAETNRRGLTALSVADRKDLAQRLPFPVLYSEHVEFVPPDAPVAGTDGGPAR